MVVVFTVLIFSCAFVICNLHSLLSPWAHFQYYNLRFTVVRSLFHDSCDVNDTLVLDKIVLLLIQLVLTIL